MCPLYHPQEEEEEEEEFIRIQQAVRGLAGNPASSRSVPVDAAARRAFRDTGLETTSKS